jgi:hypothetical protein
MRRSCGQKYAAMTGTSQNGEHRSRYNYAAILLAHYCDRLRKHWARHEGQRLTLFMHGVSHHDIPEIE